MLGQDVVLDPEKFAVQGNQIHILGKESLAPVNFAACWNSGGTPPNYLDVAATVEAAHFLVPPIVFSETDDCYHLQFDFFRNTWMVKQQQLPVPVPRIRDYDEMDFDVDDWDTHVDAAVAYPWMRAVAPSLLNEPSGRRKADVWWADDSPLVAELREHLADIAEEYEEFDDEG